MAAQASKLVSFRLSCSFNKTLSRLRVWLSSAMNSRWFNTGPGGVLSGDDGGELGIR